MQRVSDAASSARDAYTSGRHLSGRMRAYNYLESPRGAHVSTARERARIREVGSVAYTECRSIWVRGWRDNAQG